MLGQDDLAKIFLAHWLQVMLIKGKAVSFNEFIEHAESITAV